MDLSLVYFPSAVAIGRSDALEPGHAKTLTAAYLIGTRGTKRDATLLGLSVAVTHSAVVVGLSVAAVLIGSKAFTGNATWWLSVVSSILVVLLGIWLLWRRTMALGRAIAFTKHQHAKHAHPHHEHAHAPDPQPIKGRLAAGVIEIVNTNAGERLQLRLERSVPGLAVKVLINRDGDTIESHDLALLDEQSLVYQSAEAPAEPHEFKAVVRLTAGGEQEDAGFEVHEPDGHHHDHDHHHSHDHDHSHSHEHEEHDHALMSDEEHARAHAATLPEYVRRGERPTALQVMTFGAAGGLVPCPAAVSVMLLSLSLSQSARGLVLVLGFSIGLAITLVGLGLVVVTGMSRIAAGGRLSRFSAYAPSLAAALVILSGVGGLIATLVRGH